MLCSDGSKLMNRYAVATEDRRTARDIMLVSATRKFKVEDPPFQDLMLVANQKYSDAFVAWVAHRASCPECLAVCGADDQVLFASV